MKKSPALLLRNNLLRQFPADQAYLLIEFQKFIAELDADFIIIMARKAMRIYDLLLLAGGPIAKTSVLSHHVLDQDLKKFSGKRICLVDDTLILGTTLAEAARKLNLAGATVKTYVFAVDEVNWCSDLIVPDKIFVKLDDQDCRSFCAVEVAALSAGGIPYLSDFPVSELVRLTPRSLSVLHSLPDWETHVLTTPHQEKANVAAYTLLPKKEASELGKGILGSSLSELLEITKIRVFCAKATTVYWVRFVPIVTIRPIRDEDVAQFFDDLLRRLEGHPGGQLNRFREFLTKPVSQLRLIQYILSLALGNMCLTEIGIAAGLPRVTRFSVNEAVRLFGPWLRAELQFLHSTVPMAFRPQSKSIRLRNSPPEPVELPQAVVELSKSEFHEFVRGGTANDIGVVAHTRSHFVDLIRAFIGLYRKYELPARQEARRLKSRLFDSTPVEAPYRDRLQFGFAWRALAECLLEEEGMRLTLRRSNRLSLILDHLIDMGIAVPILCYRDGVLFRAYRYGEDVEFGDQEIALAYELISGCMEASQRDEIPRVVLEKFLASLLHVGVAKGFLNVWHGLSGEEGIARIGFHLHGAVSISSRHDTIFADDQESWLSRYLVQQGVLKRSKQGNHGYKLDRKPEAAFQTRNSVNEAHQLGWLLGKLLRGKTETGKSVLSENDAIILASCPQPRYAAAALAAELRLFAKLFDMRLQRVLKEIDFKSATSIRSALQDVVRSHGYTALNSARMKLEGYKAEKPRSVVNDCAAYLSGLASGSFFASHWLSDWNPVLAGGSEAQRARFDPLIKELANNMLLAAVGIFTIELSLTSGRFTLLNDTNSKNAHRDACTKIRSYVASLRNFCELADDDETTLQHLVEVATAQRPIENPAKALRYGVSWLLARRPVMRTTAAQVQSEVIEFGRTDHRTNYASVLWYDIIDSRGKKSELKGEALAEYRSRVRTFRETINRDFYQLLREVGHARDVIYSWQGRIGSKDDEKHVFFAGVRNMMLLQQAIKVLLSRAKTHHICVRALAIRADFAGDAAHKYETDPDVNGEAFWEHLSELKREIKAIELDTNINKHGRPSDKSFFWTAGHLIGALVLPRNFVAQRLSRTIATEIESVGVSTDVVGGPANWPRP